MSKPRKIQSEQTRPPADPHQMSIAFESNGLRGLASRANEDADEPGPPIDDGGRDRGRGEQRSALRHCQRRS